MPNAQVEAGDGIPKLSKTTTTITLYILSSSQSSRIQASPLAPWCPRQAHPVEASCYAAKSIWHIVRDGYVPGFRPMSAVEVISERRRRFSEMKWPG